MIRPRGTPAFLEAASSHPAKSSGRRTVIVLPICSDCNTIYHSTFCLRKTMETAFEVVTTGEEYVVMSVMGLPRFGTQALITGKPHSYDLQTMDDPKSRKKVEVYFKIDAFFPMKGL